MCGRNADLQASHIIPKFVGKWIKDTAATGFLAKVIGESVKRVQDLPTIRLLCSGCEQRFSALEKYFADNIFYPFHKNDIGSFEYNCRLESFAFSLGWRVLKEGYEAFKSERPEFGPQMKLAESTWREFLQGKRQTAYPYESHLLFLGSVDTDMDGANEKTNWYLRRSTDTTIASSSTRAFTYAKLADMVFVTSIHPTTLNGWMGTRINQNGNIANQQTVDDGEFGKFLSNRAEMSFVPTASRPSDETWKKRLQKAIKNNPKFLESESIRMKTDEMLSCYKRKMSHMPPSVIELVDCIGKQVASTKTEAVNNVWKSRRILDALADLSAEEARKLHVGFINTIRDSYGAEHNTRYHLKTHSIWITFMVIYDGTKADQQAAIKKEMTELQARQSSGKTPMAIFSINTKDCGASFESGFVIPSNDTP